MASFELYGLPRREPDSDPLSHRVFKRNSELRSEYVCAVSCRVLDLGVAGIGLEGFAVRGSRAL